MNELIGKELYCAKVGEFRKEYTDFHGKPQNIIFPKVGKLYHVRDVKQYTDTPEYVSIALVEIVNSKHGGNPFGGEGSHEPYFPITWFGDLAKLSLEEILQQTNELEMA